MGIRIGSGGFARLRPVLAPAIRSGRHCGGSIIVVSHSGDQRGGRSLTLESASVRCRSRSITAAEIRVDAVVEAGEVEYRGSGQCDRAGIPGGNQFIDPVLAELRRDVGGAGHEHANTIRCETRIEACEIHSRPGARLVGKLGLGSPS